MNKHSIISLLAWCFAAVSLAACSDGEGIDPSSAEPVVAYPYETLVADLNKADNLPVVAIVKSEAGLRSVALAILTDGGETIPVSTVTEFFDRHSFSLSEKINYKSDYVSAVVSAEDLLGRRTEAALPIRIIDIVEPPVIVFSPESWEYDETVGGDLPNTRFVVTSEVALKSIEMFRVSTEGQTQYGGTVTGGDTDPWVRYEFDALIAYGENDRGFRVRAVDSYDQVRIVSLPVKYKTVPRRPLRRPPKPSSPSATKARPLCSTSSPWPVWSRSSCSCARARRSVPTPSFPRLTPISPIRSLSLNRLLSPTMFPVSGPSSPTTSAVRRPSTSRP